MKVVLTNYLSKCLHFSGLLFKLLQSSEDKVTTFQSKIYLKFWWWKTQTYDFRFMQVLSFELTETLIRIQKDESNCFGILWMIQAENLCGFSEKLKRPSS